MASGDGDIKLFARLHGLIADARARPHLAALRHDAGEEGFHVEVVLRADLHLYAAAVAHGGRHLVEHEHGVVRAVVVPVAGPKHERAEHAQIGRFVALLDGGDEHQPGIGGFAAGNMAAYATSLDDLLRDGLVEKGGGIGIPMGIVLVGAVRGTFLRRLQVRLDVIRTRLIGGDMQIVRSGLHIARDAEVGAAAALVRSDEHPVRTVAQLTAGICRAAGGNR